VLPPFSPRSAPIISLILLAQLHATTASTREIHSTQLQALGLIGFRQSGEALAATPWQEVLGDSALLRACTATMLLARRDAAAQSCIDRALKNGRDSTWQLLRAAWLDVQRGDTTTARVAFTAAIRAAHDPWSRADVGWHFERAHEPATVAPPPANTRSQRMLDSLQTVGRAEKVAWLQLPDSLTRSWLQVQTQTYPGRRSWHEMDAGLAAHFRGLTLGPRGDFKSCVAGEDAAPPCPVLAEGMTVFSAVRWRLWDARTLAPVSAVAVRLDRSQDAQKSLALTLYQPSDCGSAGDRREVVVPLRLADTSTMRGSFMVGRAGSCDHWEVRVYRPGTTAWVASATSDLLADPAGDLAVSDLVIGTRPVTWTDSAATVFEVTPVFQRTAPVNIYLQMLAGRRLDSVSIGMTVQATTGDRASLLNIASRSSLSRGLTEYSRSIDLSRFPPGVYQLQITLRRLDGTLIAMRETPFDVH
jgi:hypothetical protein